MPAASSAAKGKRASTYVRDAKGLRAAVEAASACERIAVDTEFVGEKYFYPRLEIVQVCAGEEIFLIDAPAIDDLSPLGSVLGSAKVLKLVHAGGQDFSILRRACGAAPEPLFDTQLAAAFLGFGHQASLATLAREFAGITMDGKHTTSDWSARPLKAEQLAYAADDVAFLERIQQELLARLEKAGRRAWFEEEQAARVAEWREPEEVSEADAYRRVKNWMSMTPKELAILRELAIWREQTARAQNVPRRHLFTDEGLIELVHFQPKDRETLAKLRRVPTGSAMKHSTELFAALERGRAVPKDQWPRKGESSTRREVPSGVLELAQAILRTESERHGVAATLVATTGDLELLVGTETKKREALDIALLKGWRRELAGERLLKLLNGRISVRVGKEGLELAE